MHVLLVLLPTFFQQGDLLKKQSDTYNYIYAYKCNVLVFDGWFLIHYINTSPLSVTLDLQSVRESLYDCITSYVHIISYICT